MHNRTEPMTGFHITSLKCPDGMHAAHNNRHRSTANNSPIRGLFLSIVLQPHPVEQVTKILLKFLIYNYISLQRCYIFRFINASTIILVVMYEYDNLYRTDMIIASKLHYC